jgi:hypothetical protein
VEALASQWDAIVQRQPDDWSFIDLQLTLRDASVSEEAGLVLCPLNPWHERDWRSGVFRFRAAHTWGYGAAAELCRKRLDTLDRLGVTGTLRLLKHLSDVKPVATQGPAY